MKQHIKISYRDVEIKISKPDFITDNLTDCFGQYDNRKGLIEIQEGLSNQKDDIFHEKVKSYGALLASARNRGELTIDIDQDGNADKKVSLRSGRLTRR